VRDRKGAGIMNECITCKKEKDNFSIEWDYDQCETCSIDDIVLEKEIIEELFEKGQG
jgi:hypothetical protein